MAKNAVWGIRTPMPFRTPIFKTGAIPILLQDGMSIPGLKGFEPLSSGVKVQCRTDLATTQKSRHDRNRTHILSFGDSYTTIVLHTLLWKLYKWSWWDLNPRPSACKTDALPSELQPLKLRRPDLNRRHQGYEPCELSICSTPQKYFTVILYSKSTMSDLNRPYFCLEGRCHSQLGEWCLVKVTAAGFEPALSPWKGDVTNQLDQAVIYNIYLTVVFSFVDDWNGRIRTCNVSVPNRADCQIVLHSSAKWEAWTPDLFLVREALSQLS